MFILIYACTVLCDYVFTRDVRILKFWVRILRVTFTSVKLSRRVSASALPAMVIMFKIYRNPGPACNNVTCAKNCRCNLNFVVLLLDSEKVEINKCVFLTEGLIHRYIKNCDRVRRMVADVHPVHECVRICTSLVSTCYGLFCRLHSLLNLSMALQCVYNRAWLEVAFCLFAGQAAYYQFY